MTLEQQTEALAELDEWISDPDKQGRFLKRGADGWPVDCRLNDFRYHSSRDTIIPLRVKVCTTPELKVRWLNYARSILARRIKLVSDFDISTIKPDEDCEALLRATNMWKD